MSMHGPGMQPMPRERSYRVLGWCNLRGSSRSHYMMVEPLISSYVRLRCSDSNYHADYVSAETKPRCKRCEKRLAKYGD